MNTDSYLDVLQSLGIGISVPASATPKNMARPAAQMSEAITENRNVTLTSIAGNIRRRGATEEELFEKLAEINKQRCVPPLDDLEIASIASSVAKYPTAATTGIALTETGNAERIAARFGNDIRYVPGLELWRVWNGHHWISDTTGKMTEMMKDVARDIPREALGVGDASEYEKYVKWSRISQSKRVISASIKLAESIPELIQPLEAWDADDMLFCAENLVIDLRTGKSREPRRADLVTMFSAVKFDPNATCPEFKKFLQTVTGGDQSIEDYLQTIFGYAATGSTKEQCLFLLFGTGANGKSTLLNILKRVFGTGYCAQLPAHTLTQQRYASNGSNDLAGLVSRRVALSQEVEESSHLAESLVKQLTGGDAISTRALYKEYFEYQPKFKIFIAGNHAHVIKGDDHGIWRRIRRIPFEVSIPANKRDPNLEEKLAKELSGILNWVLAGAKAWVCNGLCTPKAIEVATEAYREDMDLVGRWIDERLVATVGGELSARAAFQLYESWCQGLGYAPMSGAALGRRLGARFKRFKKSDGNYYRGLAARS